MACATELWIPPALLTSILLTVSKLDQPAHSFEAAQIKVDLIVVGSVAVCRNGARLGKGEGFAELVRTPVHLGTSSRLCEGLAKHRLHTSAALELRVCLARCCKSFTTPPLSPPQCSLPHKGGMCSCLLVLQEYGILKWMGAIDDSTLVVTTVRDEQLIDDIPPERMLVHDVPVDIIVTPTQVSPAGIRLILLMDCAQAGPIVTCGEICGDETSWFKCYTVCAAELQRQMGCMGLAALAGRPGLVLIGIGNINTISARSG